MEDKKTGLIMEGGAMRGMFTCGVIDVMMENDITFDGAIGVSAGAVFGCNYESRQIGRPIRYNKRFCRDRRYESFHSLVTTGNLYNADFCYRQLPDELDPWDYETFTANPMDFYVCCTDVETGSAVYHRCTTGIGDDMTWMRASASMPIVSRIVEVDGYKLLDGGVADAVPLQYFESIGYNRNVVLLTQPRGFRKKKGRLTPIVRRRYGDYPAFISTWEHMEERYNDLMDEIDRQESEGKILVIRPVTGLKIGKIEKNPAELERVYQAGRRAGRRALPQIRDFLA